MLLVSRAYFYRLSVWNRLLIAHDVTQGFDVPQTFFAVAMGFGSVFNRVWMKGSPSTFNMYMFSISAGLLAGKGLAGVFSDLFAVAGIDGSVHGTAFGCPGFEYCG